MQDFVNRRFNTEKIQDRLFHPGDFSNRFHNLGDAFFSPQQPTPLRKPELVHINVEAARLLDLNPENFQTPYFRDIISGHKVFPHSTPVAAIYAGHQFGHFVPQLGDGRALLLGEIKNARNEHWEVQLKGSGITPYSRQGDGRAVLRSTIREYLCSEAMHGLGIPTTRALAMVNSQEEVYREKIETGATLVRLSPSFIRFGSFELFASRGQAAEVQTLADFVLAHYYPGLLEQAEQQQANPYQLFLAQVVRETARLIAQWQSVGFAHGVMNTDNMSILGLTLDYGPFGFLDTYQRGFICNHSDHQGRYSFQNQPSIAYWNLARLAEALLSLMTVDEASEALSEYENVFTRSYLEIMEQKLGFFTPAVDETEQKDRQTLILSLLNLMEKNQVDYTILFRKLADIAVSEVQHESSVRDLFLDRNAFDQWQQHYQKILSQVPMAAQERKNRMNQVNPKYILRNYMAQIAIEKAENEQDYSEIDKLLGLLLSPFDEHPELKEYAGFPPDWATEISVSCSS